MSVIDGARVAELRKRRGWSQHELARMAGVTAPVISRMERNLQQDFDLFVVLGVARALETSIDSLLTTPSVANQPYPLELQRALSRLDQQPEEIQRQIGRIIDAYLNAL